MPEPLPHFDIRMVGKGVRGGCGAQRVHTEPVHVDCDANLRATALDDLMIDQFRIQGLPSRSRGVLLPGEKQRSVEVLPIPAGLHIVVHGPLCLRGHGNEAHLVALPLDAEAQNTVASLIIADAKLTDLIAAGGGRRELLALEAHAIGNDMRTGDDPQPLGSHLESRRTERLFTDGERPAVERHRHLIVSIETPDYRALVAACQPDLTYTYFWGNIATCPRSQPHFRFLRQSLLCGRAGRKDQQRQGPEPYRDQSIQPVRQGE